MKINHIFRINSSVSGGYNRPLYAIKQIFCIVISATQLSFVLIYFKVYCRYSAYYWQHANW